MTLNETFTVARPPDVMTAEEAADRLRVSAKTVRREVQRGRLRACHVGRAIRITEAQLVAYLERDGAS